MEERLLWSLLPLRFGTNQVGRWWEMRWAAQGWDWFIIPASTLGEKAAGGGSVLTRRAASGNAERQRL